MKSAQHSRTLPRTIPGCCLLWLILISASLAMAMDSRADAGIGDRLQVLESRQIDVYADPSLALQQAVLMVQRGDAEAASGLLRQIAELWPDLDIGFHEALILYESREFENAIEQFSRVLKADPSSFWSLYYRAQSAAALGQLDRAIVDYNSLLSLRSDLSPGYYLTMADWLVADDKEGIAEAISLLDQRMEKVGALSVLLQRSIDLEIAQGNIAAAIQRTALFNPRIKATPEWKARLADLLFQQGRYPEAAPYLEVAREQIAGMKPIPARRETLRQITVLENLISAAISATTEKVGSPPVISGAQEYTHVIRP